MTANRKTEKCRCISGVDVYKRQMLYGVSRLTRENEKVSGDNYICRQEDSGRFVMCLSDGMGSGMDACRESEIVVELLEQFLDSGFSQETAARMVNSALVLKGREGMFSTVAVSYTHLDVYKRQKMHFGFCVQCAFPHSWDLQLKKKRRLVFRHWHRI